MMDDPNIGFVIAAYVLGLIVIAVMIAAVLIDHRGLKHALQRLSARSSTGADPEV